MVAKLVSYVFQVRRLQEITSTTLLTLLQRMTTVDATGKKSITLKSTGHEKTRVSVCLAAKADGTKLKSVVVFKGAKREVAALKQEFQHRAAVAS